MEKYRSKMNPALEEELSTLLPFFALASMKSSLPTDHHSNRVTYDEISGDRDD
jgi:hypothetical protein